MSKYHVECYQENGEVLHFNKLDAEICFLWDKGVDDKEWCIPKGRTQKWQSYIIDRVGFISYGWLRLGTHKITIDKLIEFIQSAEMPNNDPVEIANWIRKEKPYIDMLLYMRFRKLYLTVSWS
jgi:hypothetical protein